MKAYEVTIRDATEEVSFEKAKKLLKAFGDAFAAIYGYSKDGKTVWLVEPIVCKSQADVLKWQKKLNGDRSTNQVILHTLFRHNVD